MLRLPTIYSNRTFFVKSRWLKKSNYEIQRNLFFKRKIKTQLYFLFKENLSNIWGSFFSTIQKLLLLRSTNTLFNFVIASLYGLVSVEYLSVSFFLVAAGNLPPVKSTKRTSIFSYNLLSMPMASSPLNCARNTMKFNVWLKQLKNKTYVVFLSSLTNTSLRFVWFSNSSLELQNFFHKSQLSTEIWYSTKFLLKKNCK